MLQEKQDEVLGKDFVKRTFDRLSQICAALPDEVRIRVFKSEGERADVEDTHFAF